MVRKDTLESQWISGGHSQQGKVQSAGGQNVEQSNYHHNDQLKCQNSQSRRSRQGFSNAAQTNGVTHQSITYQNSQQNSNNFTHRNYPPLNNQNNLENLVENNKSRKKLDRVTRTQFRALVAGIDPSHSKIAGE